MSLWTAFKTDESNETSHAELCFEDTCPGFEYCKWKATSAAEQAQRQIGRKPGLSHYLTEEDHSPDQVHRIRISFWNHGFMWRLDAPFDEAYSFYRIVKPSRNKINSIVDATMLLRQRAGHLQFDHQYKERIARHKTPSVWMCSCCFIPSREKVEQEEKEEKEEQGEDGLPNKMFCSSFSVILLQRAKIGKTAKDRKDLNSLIPFMVEPADLKMFCDLHPSTYKKDKI